MSLFKLRWKMCYIPLINRFFFSNADEIYKQEIKHGILRTIRECPLAERAFMNISYGRFLRNRYLLWHPRNPYTTLPWKKIPEEGQSASKYHPDNYSWGVISRLLVAAKDNPAKKNKTAYEGASAIENASLILAPEDDENTLRYIEERVAKLIKDEQFDLVNEMMEDADQLHASPEKIRAIMQAIAGHEDKLKNQTVIRMCRLAQRYGVERATLVK